MAQPWLSIISPTYNGQEFLPSALNSIIVQQDQNVECIVVDDGSTDSTLSILETYQKRLPLKILQPPPRRNWVTNTNYALSFASGKYVCFLHQDDLWFQNRLLTMKQLTEQFPEVVLFLHSSNFIDRAGENLGLWSCPLPAFPRVIQSKLILERLLVQNFISIVAPIFRRETALEVGGMDDSLWYTADWDFWLKIAACGSALYYPKPLAGYRVHQHSQTFLRSSYLQDFHKQLDIVADRHLALWAAPAHLKRRVCRLSHVSTEINVALAGSVHDAKPNIAKPIISLLLLGPLGWYRYFRDSRIWERASARIKARLISSRKS